jgi:hypothetical protein
MQQEQRIFRVEIPANRRMETEKRELTLEKIRDFL